ncbi:MAG: gamma-glutamyltransferase [Phycisphaerales bacterium JB043]
MRSNRIAHIWVWCVASVALCANAQDATIYHHGVVAADHAQASEAGARILELGGNAVDAAVATSFALSVVRPQSCGIGGGGFMVIALAGQGDEAARVVALNYRETAPAAMGPDYFEKLGDVPEASTHTGHAIGVPGTVVGLLHALETYGTLDRATVMAPAIELARDGFVVDRALYKSARDKRAWFEEEGYRSERHRYFWERYVREGALEEDRLLTNPAQARALQIISDEGLEGWREKIAPSVVAAVAGAGGRMTLDDVRSYELQTLEALRGSFMEYDVYTMPPPSSGGMALLQVLGLIERARAAVDPGFEPVEYSLLLIEAFKHAFADRARWLADGVDVSHLLEDAYLDDLSSRIEIGRTFKPEHYGSSPQLSEDSGTSHISVIDRFGNAVACTETINLAFGSKIAVEEFGFFLNNEIDDLTTISGEQNAYGLVQSDANLPSPGKRPLSSMTPTIVLDEDGEVVCVAGGSGGPRIITGTIQVVLNVLLQGHDARAAVDAPRLHHQWIPDRVLAEESEVHSFVRCTPRGPTPLEGAGHRVGKLTASRAVQAIARHPEGGYTASSDYRKGGAPAGPDPERMSEMGVQHVREKAGTVQER